MTAVFADDMLNGWGTVSQTLRVRAANDDGNIKKDGTSETYTQIGMPLDSNPSTASSYNALFLFSNVVIPQAAVIQSALLYLYVYSTKIDDFYVLLYCEDVDSSGNQSVYTLAARTTTAAIAAAWDVVDVAAGSLGHKLAGDLQPAVQTVVNRAGWVSGNNLGVIVKGQTGTTRTGSVATYESSADWSAQLIVRFYTPAPAQLGRMFAAF